MTDINYAEEFLARVVCGQSREQFEWAYKRLYNYVRPESRDRLCRLKHILLEKYYGETPPWVPMTASEVNRRRAEEAQMWPYTRSELYGRSPGLMIFDEAVSIDKKLFKKTKPLTPKQKREIKMTQQSILAEAGTLVKDELRGAKVLQVKRLLEQKKAIQAKIQKVLEASTVSEVNQIY